MPRYLVAPGQGSGQVRKKILIQFLVSNLSTVATFALTVVLSRLLTPGEIGLFSMGAVLVGFSHVFRDFGVASYIKRQPVLSPEVLRPAAGLLYTTCWSMAALLFFGSNLWAQFLGHAEVAKVVRVLAIGFLFIPFGALPQAVLGREMRIEISAYVTLTAAAAYITASILFARAGFGYMTMPWANLVNILVTGIGFQLAKPAGVDTRPVFHGWGRVIGFGSGAVLEPALKALDASLPDVLLGRMATPRLVGLHSRANSTVGMINTAIGPSVQYFALPYLAKKFHEQAPLGDEIRRGMALLTGIIWPALAFTASLATAIVTFLYGSQWVPSAVAIPWLCLAAASACWFSLVAPALTGMGRPYLAALPLAISVTGKACLAYALYDGTLGGFARGMGFGELLSIPFYLWLLQRFVHVSPQSYLRAALPSAGVGLAVAATCAAVTHWLPSGTALPVLLLVAVVSCFLVWLLTGKWLQLAAITELHSLLVARRPPESTAKL